MDPVAVREEPVATTTPTPVDSGTPSAPVAPPYTPGSPTVTKPGRTNAYASRTGVYAGGYRTIQLVWLLGVVTDVILALDFAFRATGAHNIGFAHYIYRLGGWLAAPFNGIFTTTTSSGGLSVIRWSDILAVVVYTVAAWIVAKLVRITATPRTGVNAV